MRANAERGMIAMSVAAKNFMVMNSLK